MSRDSTNWIYIWPKYKHARLKIILACEVTYTLSSLESEIDHCDHWCGEWQYNSHIITGEHCSLANTDSST